MVEIRNENLVRLLRGLTIAVGDRHNRVLIYRFLAAEIRALHYSYGIGDSESYKRALGFLEDCERLTLPSLVRKSAKRGVEVTMTMPSEFCCVRYENSIHLGTGRIAHLQKSGEGSWCNWQDPLTKGFLRQEWLTNPESVE
jgi:hypothetical protein